VIDAGSGSRIRPAAAGRILLLFGAEIFNSMYRFSYFKNRLLNGREAAV
jgi:hypothetical protein